MKGILDTINTNPVFTSIVPSTGKKFKFRGYSAGEEQALLVSKESGDTETIMNNTKEVISKCTFGEVDPDKITSFDIEYILLQLRAKAVGELIELNLTCKNTECKKNNEATINIHDIKAPAVEKDANIIKLNDAVTLVMKYAGFEVLEALTKPGVDVFKIIASLITQVVKGDDVIETSELDPEEVIRFVKGMNSKVIKKISNFIYTTPAVVHTLKVKCMHCGNDNEYTFKGIRNFFS
jgi:hypothetical protein